MKFHESKRLFVVAAVFGAVAVFAIGFFVALAVRSAVADPGASAPNPGHEWSEIEGHGIDGGDYWLGTTDDNALELRVNNERALRLEPDAESPNVIGGVSFNSVTSGVKGATIAGGGADQHRNQVTDDYGVVAGGRFNLAGNDADPTDDATYATVGGGNANTASAQYTTVSGGYSNEAGGENSTVAGGYDNDASGHEATVGGGGGNTASANEATVGGGGGNSAGGDNATVAGGETNTASGYAATVAGGDHNQADADMATVGGGYSNLASNHSATVGGGYDNEASGGSATVAGGENNAASGNEATVGGGDHNVASGDNATVGGGWENWASAAYATIAGGGPSDPGDPDTTRNRVTDDYGTIGGGGNNQAGNGGPDPGDAPYATVSGGQDNTAGGYAATVAGGEHNQAAADFATVSGGDTNAATSPNATVGGGVLNMADDNSATVSGGRENTASNNDATVGGGFNNTASGLAATVAGGDSNVAVGDYAAVAGGGDNMAAGFLATVGGGHDNTAQGDYSFAAGRHGKANHEGAFVWADSNDFDFASAAVNEFAVRATGGSRIVTGIDVSGNPDAGVKLDPDDNAWEVLSDRDAKENFVVLNLQDVLNRLAGIPITEWNYKTQDPSNRHIGPMAQDFYAAFGLSADDLYISPIDTDGVALAAIQGLYELVQEQDARIQALEGEAGVSGGSAGLLSSSLTAGGLLFGALFLGGLVLVRRQWTGGRR